MDEALYRQHQTAQRLFGPSATIRGTSGTRKAPGDIRIILDGRLLGEGRTFGQALQDVTRRRGRHHADQTTLYRCPLVYAGVKTPETGFYGTFPDASGHEA